MMRSMRRHFFGTAGVFACLCVLYFEPYGTTSTTASTRNALAFGFTPPPPFHRQRQNCLIPPIIKKDLGFEGNKDIIASLDERDCALCHHHNKMALEPRKKKPLVITDKDGNVIDLGGKQSASREKNDDSDSSETTEHEPSKTVTFDVGGQIFKVSRSILAKYPTSILATLSSENGQDNPDSTIFIDADGERFRYCLDYMRHGRAFLPWTVSKDAVLQDLSYFGIEHVNPNDIDESAASLTAAAQMFKVERQYQQELKEYDAQIEEIQRTKRHVMVAHACFRKFSQSGSLHELTFGPDLSDPENPSHRDVSYEDVCSVFQCFDEVFFNVCLDTYGLYHIRNELYRLPGTTSAGYKVSLGKSADREALLPG